MLNADRSIKNEGHNYRASGVWNKFDTILGHSASVDSDTGWPLRLSFGRILY